jgi:hypothetical protein
LLRCDSSKLTFTYYGYWQPVSTSDSFLVSWRPALDTNYIPRLINGDQDYRPNYGPKLAAIPRVGRLVIVILALVTQC